MTGGLRPLGTAALPPLAGQLDALWRLVFDLAGRLDPTRWQLIGGLMVLTHGLAAGRTLPRTTGDVDVLADLIATASGLEACVSAVEAAGFEPVEDSQGNVYRFRRAHDEVTVDVLAPDHAPPRRSLRTRRNRETIVVAGGRQALARGGTITVTSPDHGRADVPVPDLLGALVLKAAAWAADARDRERHSGDAAFLTSLVQDPLAEVARYRGSDRRRLRALDRGALGRADAPEWRVLGDAAADAYLAWRILADS